MNTRELTTKARSVARCLTYNDDKHQAAAKHTLLEMAHRLDTLDIRAHINRDGVMLTNGLGQLRSATLLESFIYRIFKVLPRTI